MAKDLYVVVKSKPNEAFWQKLDETENFIQEIRLEANEALEKAGGEQVLKLGLHSHGGMFIYKFPDMEAWEMFRQTFGRMNSYWDQDIEFGFKRE